MGFVPEQSQALYQSTSGTANSALFTFLDEKKITGLPEEQFSDQSDQELKCWASEKLGRALFGALLGHSWKMLCCERAKVS